MLAPVQQLTSDDLAQDAHGLRSCVTFLTAVSQYTGEIMMFGNQQQADSFWEPLRFGG